MKKNNRPNSFIRDGLSIDETKISVLMITYIICFLATLAFFIYTQDGEGLKAIFFSNIAAITGVNISNSISHVFNSDQDEDDIPKG